MSVTMPTTYKGKFAGVPVLYCTHLPPRSHNLPAFETTADKIRAFVLTHWSFFAVAAVTLFILRGELLKHVFKNLLYLGIGFIVGSVMNNIQKAGARTTVAETPGKMQEIRDLIGLLNSSSTEVLQAELVRLQAIAEAGRTEGDLLKIRMIELKLDPTRQEEFTQAIAHLQENIIRLRTELENARKILNNTPDDGKDSGHTRNIISCVGMLIIKSRGYILSPTGFLDRWVFSQLFGVSTINLIQLGMQVYTCYNDAHKRGLI